MKYLFRLNDKPAIDVFKDRKAVCLGFCNLAVEILYIIGVKSQIVIVKYKDTILKNSHAVIKIWGLLYDPQANYIYIIPRNMVVFKILPCYRYIVCIRSTIC